MFFLLCSCFPDIGRLELGLLFLPIATATFCGTVIMLLLSRVMVQGIWWVVEPKCFLLVNRAGTLAPPHPPTPKNNPPPLSPPHTHERAHFFFNGRRARSVGFIQQWSISRSLGSVASLLAFSVGLLLPLTATFIYRAEAFGGTSRSDRLYDNWTNCTLTAFFSGVDDPAPLCGATPPDGVRASFFCGSKYRVLMPNVQR